MDDAAVTTLLLFGISAAAARAMLFALLYADDAAFELCRRWAMIAAGAVLVWLALGPAIERNIAMIAAIAAVDCGLLSRGWSPPQLPRATARNAPWVKT